MFSLERYFDNASTTPVDPLVVEAMAPFWSLTSGNPNSIHAFGIKARAAVTEGREAVAKLVGAEDPSQIVFTSGATEANNWAIRQAETGQVSPFEHPSVLEPATKRGFSVAKNSGYCIDWQDGVDLACCMAVNNETGAVLARPSNSKKVLIDATQAVGKVPFEAGEADFVSFSAHKIFGPKGVGALYIRDPRQIAPLIEGGGQQGGLRSGTLNVTGIVGFGKAALLAMERLGEDRGHYKALRDAVLNTLGTCPYTMIHNAPDQSPHILCMSFEGVEGESLVLEVDAAGYAIGSGAACSSEKKLPNRSLMALGVPENIIRGTIRISFGRQNTIDAATDLASLVLNTVKRLRKMRLFAQDATY